MTFTRAPKWILRTLYGSLAWRHFRSFRMTTRRELLDLLKEEPRATGELCSALPMLDQCTVMKHLETLVRAGLVVVERRGCSRINHLNPAPLYAIVERWVTGHTARLAESAFRLNCEIESQKEEQSNES